MYEKIKMPESLARKIAEDRGLTIYFNTLTQDEKIKYINQNVEASKSVNELK